MFIVTSLPYQFYNSRYSTLVKQDPPTFASWLPVQIGAGNQTPSPAWKSWPIQRPPFLPINTGIDKKLKHQTYLASKCQICW